MCVGWYDSINGFFWQLEWSRNVHVEEGKRERPKVKAKGNTKRNKRKTTQQQSQTKRNKHNSNDLHLIQRNSSPCAFRTGVQRSACPSCKVIASLYCRTLSSPHTVLLWRAGSLCFSLPLLWFSQIVLQVFIPGHPVISYFQKLNSYE